MAATKLALILFIRSSFCFGFDPPHQHRVGRVDCLLHHEKTGVEQIGYTSVSRQAGGLAWPGAREWRFSTPVRAGGLGRNLLRLWQLELGQMCLRFPVG